MKIDFDAVWGQSAARGVLEKNLMLDRVASAYLFAGPQGTGKTLLALLFAKALLCVSGERRPCGTCRSCKMFAAESHPDFKRISPDGTMIKIDQMRELISAVSLKSYGGGWKVAMMDEAEKMNREASNAFLKTLEEPPARTALVLVSSNPSGLLPTTVSRCRVVRFVPMKEDAFAERLARERSLGIEEARRVAYLAEGCPGRALSDGMDGVAQVDDEAAGLMDGLLEMRPEEIVDWAEGWKYRRDELPLLVDRILDRLRLAQRINFVQLSDTMSSDMINFEGIADDRLSEGFDALLSARPSLRFNPNVQLFLESNLLNLQSILREGVSLVDGTYMR